MEQLQLDRLKEIEQEHKRINGELRKENQKYKEVIDKLKEYIEDEMVLDFYSDKSPIEIIIDKLLKKLEVK